MRNYIINIVFLLPGYNDILLIPAGATNIIIQEQDAASNYLGKSFINNLYLLKWLDYDHHI